MAGDERDDIPDHEGVRVRAPELRGSAWLNTDRPLTLRDLRGKLVLLDFWTYCCINCLHVLEDLKYLEQRFAGQPFVVVGVHSPKFTNEDDAQSVRQAIARHGITHPVLLDSGRRTWDAYTVRGWPTLALVDPRGYLLGMVSGEGHREQLEAAIARALELLGEAGALDDTPLPFRLEPETDTLAASPLLFPHKVLADARSATLFIADTGHHRLVRARLDDADAREIEEIEEIEEIGNGEPGARDGDLASASFHSPGGLALDDARGWLYVADTGNHLIRRVDLRAGRVETVAGTGALGYERRASGPARAVALNSPWDLCLLGGMLYIAMAGLHQIWRYDPERETVGVYAGSGAEGRRDGPADEAALAQPSGLTSDGTRLFVADSEISAIRVVTPGADGGQAMVRTLAGGDLFQFGQRDGRGDLARFQHPLGVAWGGDAASGETGEGPGSTVYVADAYNHRLRAVAASDGTVTTLAGDGTMGLRDGPLAEARFREPGGLAYAAGRLYVADTNNHAIRVVDLAAATVSTLALPGLCAPGLCLPG